MSIVHVHKEWTMKLIIKVASDGYHKWTWKVGPVYG